MSAMYITSLKKNYDNGVIKNDDNVVIDNHDDPEDQIIGSLQFGEQFLWEMKNGTIMIVSMSRPVTWTAYVQGWIGSMWA